MLIVIYVHIKESYLVDNYVKQEKAVNIPEYFDIINHKLEIFFFNLNTSCMHTFSKSICIIIYSFLYINS